MNLLVTTSHSVLRVDGGSGAFEPVHRGLGLYFGIATDGERYYVAARGRMVSSVVPPEEESGRILVFDRALRLTGEITAPFALRDLHEILWDRGRLWITCSFDNMIAVHDTATGAWERWLPLGVPAEPPLDVNHLNSLALRDGRLFMVAHNFGASELLEFDPASRELLARSPLGMCSHNIRWSPAGVPYTCSSAEGALLATDGWRVEVGGFPRGMAQHETETYVGISEVAERKDRDLSTGGILVLDAQWRPRRTLHLEGEGLVLELHVLP